MFSFKDKEDNEDDTPFFHQENKQTSLFLSQNEVQESSAYLLFNQPLKNQPKSIVNELDQFNNNSSTSYYQPTQVQDDESLSVEKENSIIEEVNEGVDDFQASKRSQNLYQSSVKEFSDIHKLQQTNTGRSSLKQSKQKFNFPNFNNLMNSRVQDKSATSSKRTSFQVNFKSKKTEPSESVIKKSLEKLNNSEPQPSSSKTLFNPIKFNNFAIKKEKQSKESALKNQNKWNNKSSTSSEGANRENSKSIKNEKQKQISYLALKKDKMIKNEGQKLGFSIAEEMAKRDKIKIKSPDYLKFNKPKQQKKQIKKDVSMSKRQSIVEKGQGKADKLIFKYQKVKLSKDKLSDSIVNENTGTQHFPSKIINKSQFSLENRIECKKSGNCESKMMEYYSQLQQLIDEAYNIKAKYTNNHLQYQSMKERAKNMCNRVNYGYIEKQRKIK